MASGDSNKMKGDDFRHYCALCMEPYRGRTPKLLPCFHTFCQLCLTSLVERSSEIDEDNDTTKEEQETPESGDITDDAKSDVSETAGETLEGSEQERESRGTRGRREKKKFLCPTCRAPVTVPEGGVAALQTNFYLDAAVDHDEEAQSRTPVLCGMCEEGQEEEAVFFCRTCQQHMCRSCRRLHDLVGGARNHSVSPVATRPAPKPAGSKQMCQFHPDQVLCFQCCKCEVTICLHCKLTSHEGHETEDMATAAMRAKEELAQMLAKGNKQLYQLEACIRRLERDEQDLKRQQQEVIQQVSSRYDTLMAWAARSREEVLETLTAKVQISLNDILSRKEATASMKGNISSVMAHSKSQGTLAGPDIVLMKNEVQAALLSEEKIDECQELGERKESLTFFTCEAESSVLDLSVLRTYMGELMEAAEGGGSGKAWVSFRELSTLISDLQAELNSLKEDQQPEKPKVCFHVGLRSDYNCNVNNTVIFNDVKCNDGGGYNVGNGVFTAPEAGTYMFMTTANSGGRNTNYHMYLHVNGIQWGRTYTPESSTMHIVVNLNKGDQVTVVTGSAVNLWTNTCMFTGVLVYC